MILGALLNVTIGKRDLVKFDISTLVSRDCVPFCKYIKRYLYPRNQGTHDKLNQIQNCHTQIKNKINNLTRGSLKDSYYIAGQ